MHRYIGIATPFISEWAHRLTGICSGKVVPIEVKAGKAYKTHKALDNFMNISDYHIEKAYVLSVANVEQEGAVVYLPIYMCYLLKEREIGRLIVDLDMEGL